MVRQLLPLLCRILNRCCGHPPALDAPVDLSRAARQHILPAQRLLDSEAGCEAVLAYLRGDEVAARLRARWARGGARGGDLSVQRWEDLEAELGKARPCLLKQQSALQGSQQAAGTCRAAERGAHEQWRLAAAVSMKRDGVCRKHDGLC